MIVRDDGSVVTVGLVNEVEKGRATGVMQERVVWIDLNLNIAIGCSSNQKGASLHNDRIDLVKGEESVVVRLDSRLVERDRMFGVFPIRAHNGIDRDRFNRKCSGNRKVNGGIFFGDGEELFSHNTWFPFVGRGHVGGDDTTNEFRGEEGREFVDAKLLNEF